ncbi:unnamed protein product, partial [Meganyctiphanes norvegica]
MASYPNMEGLGSGWVGISKLKMTLFELKLTHNGGRGYNTHIRRGRISGYADYDDGPGWGSGGYNDSPGGWSGGGRGGRGGPGGMGMKGGNMGGGRGGSNWNNGTGHCVHMRGLPFRAAEEDIEDLLEP